MGRQQVHWESVQKAEGGRRSVAEEVGEEREGGGENRGWKKGGRADVI